MAACSGGAEEKGWPESPEHMAKEFVAGMSHFRADSIKMVICTAQDFQDFIEGKEGATRDSAMKLENEYFSNWRNRMVRTTEMIGKIHPDTIAAGRAHPPMTYSVLEPSQTLKSVSMPFGMKDEMPKFMRETEKLTLIKTSLAKTPGEYSFMLGLHTKTGWKILFMY